MKTFNITIKPSFVIGFSYLCYLYIEFFIWIVLFIRSINYFLCFQTGEENNAKENNANTDVRETNLNNGTTYILRF